MSDGALELIVNVGPLEGRWLANDGFLAERQILRRIWPDFFSIFSIRNNPSTVLTLERMTYSHPLTPDLSLGARQARIMESVVSPCVLCPVKTKDRTHGNWCI